MPDFTDKMRLKEMAEEDIYFARRDRELIQAMHQRKLAQHLGVDSKKKKKKKAEALEDRYAVATVEHWHQLKKLAKCYRSLIEKASRLVKRK